MQKKLNQMALFLTIATTCAVLYATFIFFFVEFPKNNLSCKLQGGDWVQVKEYNIATSKCRLKNIDPPNAIH